MKKICLYCLRPIEKESHGDYHFKCSQKFFGTPKAPELPYSMEGLHELAKESVGQSIAVTGVQPKLSLAFEKNIKAGISKLTFVGLWGDFILKPPSVVYAELVENEHLTMRLAQLFGMATAPFAFIRLQSGELAYLTRRMDRENGRKLAMEDLCQLSERLTEYKYRGSVEQVAKIIHRYSSNPGLDVIRFFEIVLFSYLTGNADMHLKNFSLLTRSDGFVQLAPAYDLVATQLVMPQDPEESALTINGKKSKLKFSDFQAFAANAGVSDKPFENIIRRFSEATLLAETEVNASFLSEKMQAAYIDMLRIRRGILAG
jgi:serine/threonine-protein kinase HipA